jgi:fibronectin type 3 domain-containing protein
MKRKYLALFLLCILVLTSLSGCGKKKPADKIAPTIPNGISITAVSSSEIKVSWRQSADDSGKVKAYKVYRNDQALTTTEQTSASDKTLTSKGKFCYRVSAVDEAGNESSRSTEVCAMLQ